MSYSFGDGDVRIEAKVGDGLLVFGPNDQGHAACLR